MKLAVTFRPILKWKLNIPSALRDLIVNLQERSQTDIKSFIRLKANRLIMFAKDSKIVQDLKEEVCNGLFDAVDGNFALAALKLQEISTKYDRDEVLQLVRNVKGSASLTDSVADIIREYDRTLSTNEIHTLNTLLVWAIYFPLNVEQLEAVLFVQHRKETLQLAQMIESKFSLILELTYTGHVVLKYNSIKDYFEYVTTGGKASKATYPNNLTKGEIRIVRNFVHKLCEEETYHQLGLEEFFDQKMSQSGTSVAVNCDDACAQITLICLQVIVEDFMGRAESLKWETTISVIGLLNKVVPDKLSPGLRVDLVALLIKGFRDPDAIGKFFQYPRLVWSYKDKGVKTVISLMRSTTLTSIADTAGPDNRTWVEMVLRDPNPELAVLRKSANYMAKSWLSQDGLQINDVFGWLCGYANKVRKSVH